MDLLFILLYRWKIATQIQKNKSVNLKVSIMAAFLHYLIEGK